jgi:hypothetical protein
VNYEAYGNISKHPFDRIIDRMVSEDICNAIALSLLLSYFDLEPGETYLFLLKSNIKQLAKAGNHNSTLRTAHNEPAGQK